jgi:uncharacterized membrane protein YbhN (UPF0104 family)
VGWVLVGVGAEFVSMAASGQLERLLLRAAGARLTLRSVLATAYNANSIAVSVPVVGSAIAAAYTLRDFRRVGADAGQASVALTVAGVFSAVAFAVIAALGVALTGSAAAAVLALAGGTAGAGLIAALLVSLRYDQARARLVALADWAMRLPRRVTGRPRRDIAQLLGAALERAGSLRLGYRAVAQAFGCALANWLADVCCLVCAMFALGCPGALGEDPGGLDRGLRGGEFQPGSRRYRRGRDRLDRHPGRNRRPGASRGSHDAAIPVPDLQDRPQRGLVRLSLPAAAPGCPASHRAGAGRHWRPGRGTER